jgi:hypothetical protein
MRSKAPSLFCLSLLILLSSRPANADLGQSQARNLISKIDGVSLPRSEIHVLNVSQESSSSANVTAQIELVFQAIENEHGSWQLTQVRLGQDRWEDLNVIAKAGNFELPTSHCDENDKKSSAPGNKEARCLIASLFAIAPQSDGVRIKEISSFGLPLGTKASALIVSLVDLDFRFSRDKGDWQLSGFKSGNHDWADVSSLPQAIDSVKRNIASDELATLVRALDAYRRDRGSFIVSEKESVAIDHLSPKYLSQVIRLDPWHRPYQYRGERDGFTLRSFGPDGKPDTPDDLVATNSNR